MKFEKVNNDKIKVTLNTADLEANDIDLHSFMSNSSETQSLFLSVLDKAAKDYGFSTENYRLRVETLALENGSFLLTITRSKISESGVTKPSVRKRFRVSRKMPGALSSSLMYKFNTFEDFCGFVEFLSVSGLPNVDKISKTSMLYSYNNFYYLVFSNINPKYPSLKAIYSLIVEFGTYIEYSDAFMAKLHECGSLIIKDHALKVCSKYFL